MAVLPACAGIQSALEPAGAEAAAVAQLFWTMAVGGTLIWLAVMALLLHASSRRRNVYGERAAGRLIFWGGAVFTPLVLVALLAYTLWITPSMRPWPANSEDSRLRIEVVGEQFWWRVIYHPSDGGEPIVSANEVRLPVGERVAFSLTSADVIHSFWIPALGGKMDTIPGRTNHLSLEATEPGTFRGPCTEFCGPSHALMAFAAVAMERDEFDAWLAREASGAAEGDGDGLAAFLANGCGACHAIRGTEAHGTIGPDLTHIGSRKTVGAGILPNTEEAIARFIAEPGEVKPGVKMPAFDMLPDEEIASIARYLKGLQ